MGKFHPAPPKSNSFSQRTCQRRAGGVRTMGFGAEIKSSAPSVHIHTFIITHTPGSALSLPFLYQHSFPPYLQLGLGRCKHHLSGWKPWRAVLAWVRLAALRLARATHDHRSCSSPKLALGNYTRGEGAIWWVMPPLQTSACLHRVHDRHLHKGGGDVLGKR